MDTSHLSRSVTGCHLFLGIDPSAKMVYTWTDVGYYTGFDSINRLKFSRICLLQATHDDELAARIRIGATASEYHKRLLGGQIPDHLIYSVPSY